MTVAELAIFTMAMGGSVVLMIWKNAMAAGKNASAYSSGRTAELHLARCLNEEGAYRLRVNTVTQDAILQGPGFWDSSSRTERAQAYGIESEGLKPSITTAWPFLRLGATKSST